MWLFALATLAPVALTLSAAVWGGWWSLIAPFYMAGFVPVLDELVKRVTPPRADQEFPAADPLSVVIALSHFVLLIAAILTFGSERSIAEKLGLFIALGLFFGQVSNSNAHELIHRQSRFLRRLGTWVYISLLWGHHASAHVLVHHRFVATEADPNSARKGESFYRFAKRAAIGSFREGYAQERLRLSRIGKPARENPYVVYVAGGVGFMVLSLALGGIKGLIWFIFLCLFAQCQLLLSDYVQHYGLRRAEGANGKPEPVSDRHSWNSPHWYSSALMLNAPRHSDHHARPMRPYPALTLTEGPKLPRSLPVMACVALYPRLWKRVMDPRVAEWEDHGNSSRQDAPSV